MEPQISTPIQGPLSVPPSADDKMLGLISHLGPIAAIVVSAGSLGWAVPLILMLTKGRESPFVRSHAVESLNFQITLFIALAIGVVLTVFTLGLGACLVAPILSVVGIAAVVFEVLAAVKANHGELYRYPVNVRLIR